ncbi:MAG: hypothetical protein R6V53_06345 [Candidatus Woesearchaeota archaeon]
MKARRKLLFTIGNIHIKNLRSSNVCDSFDLSMSSAIVANVSYQF